MGSAVTNKNWQRTAWRGGRDKARTAWEEGLRQKYKEVTGQSITGSGLELKEKAARGLMKHFAETHKTDAKPPSRKQLIRIIAHDFGLGRKYVQRTTVDEKPPWVNPGRSMSFADRQAIRERFFAITGQRLDAPHYETTSAAVRELAKFLLKKHHASGRSLNKNELSLKIADLLDLSSGTVRKRLTNVTLPWLQESRSTPANAEKIQKTFERITGKPLTNQGNINRAAVLGLAAHLSQHPHDQIGVLSEPMANTIHRLSGIRPAIVQKYLREARRPPQTSRPRNA